MADTPTVRWGIVTTGLISSWFVEDLALPRGDAKAKHVIQCIGSSSVEKGQAFVKEHIASLSPTLYGTYDEVYADPNVDVVYIGTPHAFHKKNCLDAINAGKHVLCEKAFTITAKEAREVFAAAKAKGVFVMEAMWTRFFPLMRTLQKLIHEDKVIGDVSRMFCDFGQAKELASLGPDSRFKSLALGAGTLLDVGIYSLTFGLVTLDPGVGESAEMPKIAAQQTLSDGVDIATTAVLLYKSGRQGIVTSSALFKTPDVFCRIEGSKGYITVEGDAVSRPEYFIVHPTVPESKGGAPSKRYDFENPKRGFYWEADAVALDVAAVKKESSIMPWAETIRVMEIMDEIRRQGGAKYPQDDE
ncbi:hypothetical protein BDY21DRAFT_371276 [Lineolata rhizophorae]|uniref:D-xylose 1-dehydrogenase (NADP(+), D-xylono-1,5-lactone-forming) n=1 Tax=Lineolata rhizophorae TaxID=578093 RepID=A0A6A6P1J8_9PEZI|nr:hypothetical protein BDY21DRAFT_371276 [Lineolata rhizophorae]